MIEQLLARKNLYDNDFDLSYPKGTKQNPMIITVRQESIKNRTLTITISKSVLAILDTKIKKGDRLLQWADCSDKTIRLAKL